MLGEQDDFVCSFKPCPEDVAKLAIPAQKSILALLSAKRNRESAPEGVLRPIELAPFTLFYLGLHFYGAAGWYCNDYIPAYGLCGDAFKTAGDGFVIADELLLAAYAYGRAGHAYRAANEPARSTYAFFRAYEIALALRRNDLVKYFCAESWKMILDRWLMMPQVIGSRVTDSTDMRLFLLRMDGYDFQWLVWFLLSAENFVVDVAKQTHDNGVDIFGSITTDRGQEKIIVQCKNPRRRGKKIAAAAIRELLGAYLIHKPHRVMFCTTTAFSKAAEKTVAASGVLVELVDADRLFERLRKVHRLEVCSDDVVARDDEERQGILRVAKRIEVDESIVTDAYELQRLISRPLYLHPPITRWLMSLPRGGFS